VAGRAQGAAVLRLPGVRYEARCARDCGGTSVGTTPQLTGVVTSALWPAYAAVREAMTFTWPMMIARLAIGRDTAVVRLDSRKNCARSTFESGPDPRHRAARGLHRVHVNPRDKFPVWDHLTFLVTIVLSASWAPGSHQRASRPRQCMKLDLASLAPLREVPSVVAFLRSRSSTHRLHRGTRAAWMIAPSLPGWRRS
jgi:hypothetical protein